MHPQHVEGERDTRIPASTSRTPFARCSEPVAIDTERRVNAGRWRIGRAYRAGRLICGCVQVAVSLDERVGLTERERRIVRVRFCEPVDDDLRVELTELARRRGAASLRAAERIAPIELVVVDPHSEHERIVGGLQPPYKRHGPLRGIEFGFGQLRAR